MSLKKEKELFTRLKYFKKDKIEEWLNDLKKMDKSNGKVPGLLNDSKLNLETTTQNGGYNLILKWISLNLDKFGGFDFKDIPPSKSDRYSKNPMVIQGPGAGPEVTAAGIFSDIVTLLKLIN